MYQGNRFLWLLYFTVVFFSPDMANSRVGQCVGNQKDTSVLEKLRQKLSSIGLQDRDGCGMLLKYVEERFD